MADLLPGTGNRSLEAFLQCRCNLQTGITKISHEFFHCIAGLKKRAEFSLPRNLTGNRFSGISTTTQRGQQQKHENGKLSVLHDLTPIGLPGLMLGNRTLLRPENLNF